MWHPQLVFVLASDREVITPAQIAAALRDLDATDTATGSRVGLRRVLPWRSRKSSVTLQPLAVQGFLANLWQCPSWTFVADADPAFAAEAQ